MYLHLLDYTHALLETYASTVNANRLPILINMHTHIHTHTPAADNKVQ